MGPQSMGFPTMGGEVKVGDFWGLVNAKLVGGFKDFGLFFHNVWDCMGQSFPLTNFKMVETTNQQRIQ